MTMQNDAQLVHAEFTLALVTVEMYLFVLFTEFSLLTPVREPAINFCFKLSCK